MAPDDFMLHPRAEQQLRVLRIIWTALFVSPLLLMGVMHSVRSTTDPSEDMDGDPAERLFPLIVVAFVVSVVAPVMGRFLEGAMLRAAHTQQPRPKPLALLTTLTILRGALGEGAALIACVTYLLTGSPLTYVPFFIGLAAMLWVRPTEERLDTLRGELGGSL